MPNKMKTFKNYYVNVGGAGHRFAGVAFIPIRFGPSFFYVHDDLALFVIESCKSCSASGFDYSYWAQFIRLHNIDGLI